MHSAEQEAFEDKLAHLNASNTGFWRRVSNSLLRTFWWCCCCFWFASDPYKPETKEWAVLTADDHVARPAHLKISTSDQRAVGADSKHIWHTCLATYTLHKLKGLGTYNVEIKIVYAVNPNVASQLYEVDVFMFFLQDLEAVSINFYHDLWQSVRLHTPKVHHQLCPAVETCLCCVQLSLYVATGMAVSCMTSIKKKLHVKSCLSGAPTGSKPL